MAAIRDHAGRVLLCHRTAGRRHFPNVWDFPGGHVEIGESFGQAPVRELREELGITIVAPAGPPLTTFTAGDAGSPRLPPAPGRPPRPFPHWLQLVRVHRTKSTG